LSSSMYEFVEENGRTFHRYKEGSESMFKLPSNKLLDLSCVINLKARVLPPQ
jgi:hypothetical protein